MSENEQAQAQPIPEEAQRHFDAVEVMPAADNTTPPPDAPKTEEVLEPLIFMLVGMLAPNWHISRDETCSLAQAYGGLVDKYFPEGITSAKWAPEITALIITAGVIMPRMGTPRHKPEEKPVAKPKQEPATHEETATTSE